MRRTLLLPYRLRTPVAALHTPGAAPSMRRVCITLLGCGVLLAAACASSLREPPPVTRIAGAPGAGGRSAAELLTEARAQFERRPDAAEVRRAEASFLAAAEADPAGSEGLTGAVEAKVWLLEHTRPPDAATLATSAVDSGQLCLRRAPRSAACHYALALALGVQARERHETAVDGLKRMVEHLSQARAADPALDRAGPDRVLALVLLRAPGWPMGPGDPEGGLAHAREAVRRFPDFPPNPLALAEALLADGRAEEGHAAAQEAVRQARALAQQGDPDAGDWIRAGERLAAAPARRPGA